MDYKTLIKNKSNEYNNVLPLCITVNIFDNTYKFSKLILSLENYNVNFNFLQNGTGDANDVWKLMVIGAKDGTEVTAVTSKLRFIHYLQSCILTTSGKQLPKWGFEQQEVSCNPNLRDSNGIWNVEENIFDKCK